MMVSILRSPGVEYLREGPASSKSQDRSKLGLQRVNWSGRRQDPSGIRKQIMESLADLAKDFGFCSNHVLKPLG